MRFRTRATSMKGNVFSTFTLVFLLLIGVVMLILGIFDYISPQMLMLGKISYVFMFVGGMILVLGIWSSISLSFQSKVGAWVGAFFIVCVMSLFIAALALAYEGGSIFG